MNRRITVSVSWEAFGQRIEHQFEVESTLICEGGCPYIQAEVDAKLASYAANILHKPKMTLSVAPAP